ncbi:hypothetical protein DSL72_003639 [Monilinia vaccinii-corymbosi]|uniref:Uncharacterized protein n=1 Tax=Monilinia vaccinii-corymbosi TaxID=61207 RepID=A0A8A3P851_9HELO|nr:hypothetical protein DSL72_003639 [Monilinia vaccinii-corymbosi]
MADAHQADESNQDLRMATVTFHYIKVQLEFWKAIESGMSYGESKGILALSRRHGMTWEEACPRTHSYLENSSVEARQAFAQRIVCRMQQALDARVNDALRNLRDVFEAVMD